jgi:hypothetical protein
MSASSVLRHVTGNLLGTQREYNLCKIWGFHDSDWRMASSGMLRCVALVRIDVSEELSASFIRVTRIGELGTTLAVTSNRRTLRRNTRATHHNIPEDAILLENNLSCRPSANKSHVHTYTHAYINWNFRNHTFGYSDRLNLSNYWDWFIVFTITRYIDVTIDRVRIGNP